MQFNIQKLNYFIFPVKNNIDAPKTSHIKLPGNMNFQPIRIS